ncbi:MAG: DUF1206 domain-containing protein [Sterolibacteriaceae bacterium]|uniref:DUF1206 domain-containing protein n=1 Tax=Candidatus Methylophosphatis roskildensis TaxID=2899263 RepID=A0A9D7HLP3_9PROT|nr:DUF1206 domain-containing protein [Candidatus Methylophosphatis roskildensis]
MVPPIYYAFNRNFNYQKYLEEKSHVDRVVLSVDSASQKIIGNTQLIAENLGINAQAISEGFSDVSNTIGRASYGVETAIYAVADTVGEGLSQITVDLNSIGENVEMLTSVCEIGFQQLNAATLQSNRLLDEIVTLLEDADRTWARAKFRRAIWCKENKLWHEALENCSNAIGRDKLEPRFYFLRGSIYLGEAGVDPKLVDLDKAEKDFLSCAKFCGTSEPQLKQKALIHAGWAKYCAGKPLEAIGILLDADRIFAHSRNPEISFYLAKCYLHIGDTKKAKQHFQDSIQGGELYAIRAENDQDFIPHIVELRAWMEEKRADLAREINSYVEDKFVPPTLRRLASLAGQEQVPVERMEAIFSHIRIFSPPNLTLTEIFRFNKGVGNELLKAAKEQSETVLQRLDQKADRLINGTPATAIPEIKESRKNADYREAAMWGTSLAGAAIGVIVAIVIAISESSRHKGFELFLHWVIGAPFGAIVLGIAGAVVGWLLGAIFGWLRDTFRMISEESEQVARQKAAIARRDEEKIAIEGRRECGEKLKMAIGDIKENLRPLLEFQIS